jgi:hypothetical protein
LGGKGGQVGIGERTTRLGGDRKGWLRDSGQASGLHAFSLPLVSRRFILIFDLLMVIGQDAPLIAP